MIFISEKQILIFKSRSISFANAEADCTERIPFTLHLHLHCIALHWSKIQFFNPPVTYIWLYSSWRSTDTHSAMDRFSCSAEFLIFLISFGSVPNGNGDSSIDSSSGSVLEGLLQSPYITCILHVVDLTL